MNMFTILFLLEVSQESIPTDMIFWEVLAGRYDSLALYGYGIEEVPEKYSFVKKYKGDVWSHQYADILNKSKIAINLMLDSFDKVSSGVNQRTLKLRLVEHSAFCSYG